jgi:hypothetical protein
MNSSKLHPEDKKDFFISYNRADKQWAEWIAWILEEAGFSVILQAWDFRPGGNFVLDMQKAATISVKTIAVLSEAYLKSSYTQPEWAAAFADDPQSLERKLIPVKVKPCRPGGMLRPIVYVDLVGLSEAEARQTLLGAMVERAKPEQKPMFPATQPSEAFSDKERVIETPQTFPGALSQVQQIKEKSLQQRLDNLMSDYEALAKQRNYTTNVVDRNAIERQMEVIAEELDKVASDLDALGR